MASDGSISEELKGATPCISQGELIEVRLVFVEGQNGEFCVDKFVEVLAIKVLRYRCIFASQFLYGSSKNFISPFFCLLATEAADKSCNETKTETLSVSDNAMKAAEDSSSPSSIRNDGRDAGTIGGELVNGCMPHNRHPSSRVHSLFAVNNSLLEHLYSGTRKSVLRAPACSSVPPLPSAYINLLWFPLPADVTHSLVACGCKPSLTRDAMLLFPLVSDAPYMWYS